jgi:hypothetical protein
MDEKFSPGARVRITAPDSDHNGQCATVYNYLPSRPYPWHVRPDGWSEDEPGIAYGEDELELIEQEMQ